VSGHPRRDELRDLIGWVRPQTLIPVHGEALHLFEHAELARAAGVPNVLVCRNGDLVRLGPGDPGIIDKLPSGRLYRDGNLLEDSKSRAVVERRRMAFAGCAFVAIALSEKGEQEAVRSGVEMRDAGLRPDVVHTSVQRRAISTACLALDAADRHWIPVRRSWRLNGRHYGALQGQNKDQVLRQYSERQFRLWRRSYDVAPPPLTTEASQLQLDDPRYAMLPPEAQPRAESLRDVSARLLPYWYDAIVPDLRAGRLVLVAAHGNSLRALVKHLDGISDDAIAKLNIPTGIPLRYDLAEADDGDLTPTNPGGTYLDPEAAKDAIAAVANQGR